MPLLQCDFYSEVLGIMTNMTVILPDKYEENKLRTLYFLPGWRCIDETTHLYTSLRLYAHKYQLAIVLPTDGIMLNNNIYGVTTSYTYWDFLTSEMVEVSRKLFNLSHERDDTSVAGISIGGFGAFKLALNRPDKFAIAGSLGGILMPQKAFEEFGESYCKLFFSKDLDNTENDLMFVANKLNQSEKQKPKLYQLYSTDDFAFGNVYEQNLELQNFLVKNNYNLESYINEGGHKWSNFDKSIQDFLHCLSNHYNNIDSDKNKIS